MENRTALVSIRYTNHVNVSFSDHDSQCSVDRQTDKTNCLIPLAHEAREIKVAVSRRDIPHAA